MRLRTLCIVLATLWIAFGGACNSKSSSRCDEEPGAPVPEDCRVCPEQTPLVGEVCDEGATAGPCRAIDPCNAQRSVYCRDGRWVLTATIFRELTEPEGDEQSDPGASAEGLDQSPFCPGSQPIAGSPCCSVAYPGFCPYNGGVWAPGAAGAGSSDDQRDRCLVCSGDLVWAVVDDCP